MMKLTKLKSAAIGAVVLTLSMSITSLADWQYTLSGPMAVWTNTVTGEQTTVFAGQPAPDGTPAPQLTLTAPVTTQNDTASAIEAANAAADAAKAARGGNVTSGNTLTEAQLAANTAAANVNTNTNMVAVIDKTLNKGSTKSALSNADLPTIATSDQTAANTNGISDGTYVGPANSVTAKISGTVGVQNGTYSYQASPGHLVTNAASPEVKVASTTSATTSTSASTSGTTTASAASGTAATQNSAAATAKAATETNAAASATAVNYTGELPSTGSSNVKTYNTPTA